VLVDVGLLVVEVDVLVVVLLLVVPELQPPRISDITRINATEPITIPDNLCIFPSFFFLL
jgi:hypothetical protein